MKEDSKPCNVACSSFMPHRFKATQCSRCLRSHAQHKQFMKGNQNYQVQIMELRSDQDSPLSTSDEETLELKKSSADDVTTDYYDPESVRRTEQSEELSENNRRQIPKKSATTRNREVGARRAPRENGLRLNIPVDAMRNDLSGAMDVNENKESNRCGSVSENGSMNGNNSNPELLHVFRNNANTNGVNQDETNKEVNGSVGVQYLKAFKAGRKSSIPIPKTTRESLSDSKTLQEFQEVAKNLRHVSNANLEYYVSNGTHESESHQSPSPSSQQSLCFNSTELEERQRMMEAKSSETLANTAFQAFSGHSKHDTLPRNLGTAAPRPSIVQSVRHQRQSSDPEVFHPVDREEMQVVSMSTAESPKSQELSSKKQVVTSSRISSEIYFGSNTSRNKSNMEQMANKKDVFESFMDHTEKPVMIVAADGSISHYRGMASTSSESNEDIAPRHNQNGRRLSQPKYQVKPYRVVDVSHQPLVASPEFNIPISPRLPLSPAPDYRSSSGDRNVDSEQDSAPKVTYRLKDSLAKFPKRNVALVDGIYSMKDGVQLSQDDSDNFLLSRTNSTDFRSPLSDDGDTTPTFPILLSESESDQSDKRRNSSSSNYKVAIFISPKNYDNLGTALSDRESSVNDLSKDIPGPSDQRNHDYLTPMHQKKEAKQDGDEAPTVPVRSISETQLFEPDAGDNSAQPSSPCKQIRHPRKPRKSRQGKEPNSNNSQSSTELRWRSKTHPIGLDPIYAKIDPEKKKSNSPVSRSNTDVGKSRQKRVAPLPPNGDSPDAGNSLPSSLPRGLPPPPPCREKKGSVEMDSSEVPPGRPGKLAISSPDSQLGVIYEAVSRDQSPTKSKPVLGESAPPSKPLSASINSPTRQGSTPSTRAQSPQGRHSVTPTKGRVQSPNHESKRTPGLTSSMKSRDVVPVSSPPRPMSPPIPCNQLAAAQLPDTSPYQTSPNSKENKSKRSKLPWKRRRKRDDSGSPERGFDSTEVEKWLETVHQLKREDDVQRNSMERLEVINAYRGEQTAFINHSDLTSPSTSPEQNGEDSDGSGIRMRLGNSSSKRRAPKPPGSGRPASWIEGAHRNSPTSSTEDIQQLKKCYSLSPKSKRRASDGASFKQYENAGVLRQVQMKNAPPKPERRRRNMTTAFENLPSHKESVSPRGTEPPVLRRQTSSDPDIASTAYEPVVVGTSSILKDSTPLKSALKIPGSFESKKAESDPKTQPRRPVRIIAPEKASTPIPPTSVNVYSNIEIVQRGLGASNGKRSLSSVIFTADAETQCTPIQAAQTQPSLISQDLSMLVNINRTTLGRLAMTSAPVLSGFEVDMKPWEDILGAIDEPCCNIPGGVFYKVPHLDQQVSVDTALMIGRDGSQASDLLHTAQCSQTISTHPNILNVYHASIEAIPCHMLEDNQSKNSIRETAHNGQSDETVEAAVIVTDRVPITYAGNYVNHNKELHEFLPEKYEHDVAVLLLQLLGGLHHLQLHRVCLTSIKPDHLLLVDSKLPGGGLVLVINHLISHIQRDPTSVTDNQTPSDIYGSPEKLAEKIAEFDVGLLVYKFLHQPNPFAVKTSLITQDYEPHHLPVFPMRSKYSQGLCKIARGLLAKKPSDRLCATQAISMLQCLLWGPEPNTQEITFQRWLVTEQASKVASMCEYCITGSSVKGAGFSITDQLHCQFLSDTSVPSLCESMAFLYQ